LFWLVTSEKELPSEKEPEKFQPLDFVSADGRWRAGGLGIYGSAIVELVYSVFTTVYSNRASAEICSP
jgi:hypothetical protein